VRAIIAAPTSARRGCIMDDWSRRFEDPIMLLDGRTLSTLREAGDYIIVLPKAVHEAPEWQAAMEALVLVVTLGGPTMFARIGIRRALNRGHVREFDSTRKESSLGKSGS